MATKGESDWSSPPQQLIHDAREEAHHWRYMANRARSQLPGGPPESIARREFHHAVENYWSVVKPAVEKEADKTPTIEQLWRSEPLFDIGGQTVVGLEQLEHVWEWEQPITDEHHSMLHGTQQTVEYRPVILDPSEASIVLRLLDSLVQHCGWGASASGSTPRTEITEELIEEVDEWRKQNL
jgi:hypothetical protein